MKRFIGIGMLAAAVTLTACPAGKVIAKSVIDIGLALCIAAHPDEDAKSLKSICSYADELAPAVQELLSAQKKAAMSKAGACAPASVATDAGAPMAAKDAGTPVAAKDGGK
jgi:hypothetical protein